METFYFLGNSSENGFSLNSASKCLRGEWICESGLAVLGLLAGTIAFTLCERREKKPILLKICPRSLSHFLFFFHKEAKVSRIISLWKHLNSAFKYVLTRLHLWTIIMILTELMLRRNQVEEIPKLHTVPLPLGFKPLSHQICQSLLFTTWLNISKVSQFHRTFLEGKKIYQCP